MTNPKTVKVRISKADLQDALVEHVARKHSVKHPFVHRVKVVPEVVIHTMGLDDDDSLFEVELNEVVDQGIADGIVRTKERGGLDR